MVIRRILGLIILLTALAIAGGSVYAAVAVGDALANLSTTLSDNLALAAGSLNTARDSLLLSRDTFDDVGGGLGTAVLATANAASTIADSQPMVDNVAIVTTQEVPEAIEGIQAALPNLIQVAGGIDDTLRTLSSLGIDRTINLPFGGSIPIQFDLGIDYAPEEPFDVTLRDFQTSLDGLPESMRGLEDDLRLTSDNLSTLAIDLQAASDNLAVINSRVGEVLPLLDQYLTLTDQLTVTVTRLQGDVERQLAALRLWALVILGLLALSQLAPLVLGWELLTGRRTPARPVEVIHETIITPPAADTAPLATTVPVTDETVPFSEETPLLPASLEDDDHV